MENPPRKAMFPKRGLKRELDIARRTVQKLSFVTDKDDQQTYSPSAGRVTKLPRLTGHMTIREKTMINPASQFSEHIETFYHEVAEVLEKHNVLTKKKCKALMNLLIPRFRGNKFNIQFREPIHVGSVYEDLNVFNSNEIEVLLPFEAGDITVDTLDAGYVSVGLPRLKKTTYDDEDKWLYGRGDDERHLSPVKTVKSIHKIVERALKHPFEIESVQLMPCFNEYADVHQILLVVNDKLKIFLTPTIAQKESRDLRSDKPFLVPRSYAYDENTNSDIMWRSNYWWHENKIIKTVNLADRGTRQKAFKTFKAFILRDQRLEGITSYQLKTVFLRYLDNQLECNPRWQRDNIDFCFRALLRELYNVLRLGRLPHFFMSGLNLFDNVPERVMARIRGRVGFYVNNEREVTRMLKKRPKKKVKVERTEQAASVMENDVMSVPDIDRLPKLT